MDLRDYIMKDYTPKNDNCDLYGLPNIPEKE